MNDAYGDDFYATVKASSEKEARSILELAYDDASVGKLINNFKDKT